MPLAQKDTIVMSHGSGGRMTLDLIRSTFQKHFHNSILSHGNDFADLPIEVEYQNHRIIVSTDGHIVNPLFFRRRYWPPGNFGTVNDISMSGAIPKYITASFIIEEGFSISDLERIAASMQQTAEEAVF